MWLPRQEGFFSLCYLDDFVLIELSRQRAVEAYASFNCIVAELGLKLAPLERVVTWLGFVFNTIDMSITLPKDKLDEVLGE